MMTRCWVAEPIGRPSFKEIVCDVESLLSQEAEYIEFNTYQEEKYNVLVPHVHQNYVQTPYLTL
jgi:hypothetical protein